MQEFNSIDFPTDFASLKFDQWNRLFLFYMEVANEWAISLPSHLISMVAGKDKGHKLKVKTLFQWSCKREFSWAVFAARLTK